MGPDVSSHTTTRYTIGMRAPLAALFVALFCVLPTVACGDDSSSSDGAGSAGASGAGAGGASGTAGASGAGGEAGGAGSTTTPTTVVCPCSSTEYCEFFDSFTSTAMCKPIPEACVNDHSCACVKAARGSCQSLASSLDACTEAEDTSTGPSFTCSM